MVAKGWGSGKVGKGLEGRDFKGAWGNYWELLLFLLFWWFHGIYTYICQTVWNYIQVCTFIVCCLYIKNYAFWSSQVLLFTSEILFVGDKKWFFQWTPIKGIINLFTLVIIKTILMIRSQKSFLLWSNFYFRKLCYFPLANKEMSTREQLGKTMILSDLWNMFWLIASSVVHDVK